METASAVPYMVAVRANDQTFYCHRDDHTLIRKPENKPRSLGKTIAKRFEFRQSEDGTVEQFDHVTLRSKKVQSEQVQSELYVN